MTVLLPANHGLFQAANSFLFLSYVSRDVLQLRLVLAFAAIFFMLWSGLILDFSLDTFLWNFVFGIINSIQAVLLIYQRRPIKFDRPEHEDLYENVFANVGMSRLQFKTLASESLWRTLKAGSTYVEKGNEARNLTLIYKGRMDVKRFEGDHAEVLNVIDPYQWVESPEWTVHIGMVQARLNKRNKAMKRAEGQAVHHRTLMDKILGRNHAPVTTHPVKKLNRAASMSRVVRRTSDSDAENPFPADMETIVAEESDEDFDGVSQFDEIGLANDDEGLQTINVTVTARQRCQFITWPVEKLTEVVVKDPALMVAVNAVVGADVSAKLFHQTQSSSGEAASMILNALQSQRLDYSSATLMFSDEAAAIMAERWGMQEDMIDNILKIGRFRTVRKADVTILHEGEEAYEMGLILRGSFEARKGNLHLHDITHGMLIGSMSLLDDGHEHLSQASIISKEPCVYLSWEAAHLRTLIKGSTQIRATITTAIAQDVTTRVYSVEDELEMTNRSHRVMQGGLCFRH
eukprot:GFYU01005690.1.p1 GENE.GFYU01005690.1~~GFYU01005690.1.p1  ORF type:complete len:518 (-),score=98.48 GFYU01005690.1:353-1906(-)